MALTALLLLALGLGVARAQLTVPTSNGNYTCLKGQEHCCVPSNMNDYEDVKTASRTAPNGYVCNTNKKWRCQCSQDVWRFGTWKLALPVPLNYLNSDQAKRAGDRSNPYNIGITTRQRCCDMCLKNNQNTNVTTGVNCNYWMHYLPPVKNLTSSSCTNSATCGYCLIFPAGVEPTCDGPECTDNRAPQYGRSRDVVTLGKGCLAGRDDPHFVGAHGTHFDFNGVPDQTFCLLTDPAFHVNMKMTGYYDERTYGASLLKNGKAVRTWIKDLGIVWVDPATSAQHGLKLTARAGKSMARDGGFLASMEFDGVVLARMVPGDKLITEGGLTVTMLPYETQGGGFFDVDVYEIDIEGLLSVEVKLRAAHPLLQSETDAMTHINVQFHFVAHGEKTHGVLGQTFQEGRQQRALDYTALAGLLGAGLSADSELGAGFLDGMPADYVATDVMATDCKFSSFSGKSL